MYDVAAGALRRDYDRRVDTPTVLDKRRYLSASEVFEVEWRYSLDPAGKRLYKAVIRDGKLFGGLDGPSATELIPLSLLVYLQAGSTHTMIFVADAKGAMTEAREIHKYNELAYKRLTAAPEGPHQVFDSTGAGVKHVAPPSTSRA